MKFFFLFLALCTAALWLRFIVGQGALYEADFTQFVEWADNGAKGAFSDIYRIPSVNYPPVTLFLFWVTGLLREHFPDLTLPMLQYVSLKFPFFLIDCLTAGVIASTAWRSSRKIALGLGTLYLFNPAVIADSALWGQTDGIVALFPLLALLAISRNALYFSGCCLGLAILSKFQTVPLVAFLIGFVFLSRGIRATLSLSAGALTAMAILLAPFYLRTDGFNLTGVELVLHRAYLENFSMYQEATLSALNLWFISSPIFKGDAESYLLIGNLPVTAKLLGLFLFAASFLIILFSTIRRKTVEEQSFCLGLICLAFFLFPTEIHERYALPAIAFFTLSANSSRGLILLAATTAIHLLSCYWLGSSPVWIFAYLILPIFFFALFSLPKVTFHELPITTERERWLQIGILNFTAVFERFHFYWIGLLLICTGGVMYLVSGRLYSHLPALSLRTFTVSSSSSAKWTCLPNDQSFFCEKVVILSSGNRSNFAVPRNFSYLHGMVSLSLDSQDSYPECRAEFVLTTAMQRKTILLDVKQTSVNFLEPLITAEKSSNLELTATLTSCPSGAGLMVQNAEVVQAAELVDSLSEIPLSFLQPRVALISNFGRLNFNRSINNSPLIIGSRKYETGLSMQASAAYSFDIPPGMKFFRSDVGIASYILDPVAKVQFLIALDDVVVYRSDLLSAGQSGEADVAVANARSITLMVDAVGQERSDHANWGGARFVKE